MLGLLPETLLEFAPSWAWMMGGFVFILIVWTQGNNDENPEHDPVFRLFKGFVLTVFRFAKIVWGILIFVIELIDEVKKALYAALTRIGRYIEENVTIEVHLDGTFWRLVILLVLIGAGYTTLSALGL